MLNSNNHKNNTPPILIILSIIAILIIVTRLIFALGNNNPLKSFFVRESDGGAKNNISQEKVSNENVVINVETKKDGPYKVIKVVDGDTVDLEINGETKRLRLIGINTPETVDPRKPIECFGKEASNKTKELLENKSVYIESDSSQQNIDKYGRLLRYIYLENGASFNKKMIEDGYAYEYTYDIPYKYQKEYKEAQNRAEIGNLGLWKECEKKSD